MTEGIKVTEKRIFETTDRIMCFHGPLAYEAKILQVRKNEDSVHEYFIHYTGWKKTWDEWVDSTRILDYNEETVKVSKALAKSSNSSKRKNTMTSGSINNTNSNNKSIGDEATDGEVSLPNTPKRMRNNVVETEEQFVDRLEVKITIPNELKQWLIEDCTYVSKNSLLILPAKITVSDILEHYVSHGTKQKLHGNGNIIKGMNQVKDGLIEYFNTMLPKSLLLKNERKQYEEITKKYPDKMPVDIYGAHHLLRLFVIQMVPPPPPPPPAYLPGEKILCYHGPLIYEAKCLDHRIHQNNNVYLVHYQGWNKNWDEWVPDSRILKYNDENLKTQKKLANTVPVNRKRKSALKITKKNDATTSVETEAADTRSRSSTPNTESKPKKKLRKKDEGKTGKKESQDISEMEAESADESSTPVEAAAEEPKVTLSITDFHFDSVAYISNPENAKLEIPEVLKKWLLDDYDFIIRQKKLVNLPAEVSVHDILKSYLEFKIKSIDADMANRDDCVSKVKETVDLLEKYFNTSLGSFLLFKWERTQYSELLLAHQEAPPSRLYGAHHLLRLICKSSDVLALVHASAVESLVETLEDLIKYLVTREKELFSFTNYGIAPPEYHRCLL